MKVTKKTFQYGEHEVSIETGAVARQADGAVLVNMAETVVLVTAVGRKTADPGRDFFISSLKEYLSNASRSMRKLRRLQREAS